MKPWRASSKSLPSSRGSAAAVFAFASIVWRVGSELPSAPGPDGLAAGGVEEGWPHPQASTPQPQAIVAATAIARSGRGHREITIMGFLLPSADSDGGAAFQGPR